VLDGVHQLLGLSPRHLAAISWTLRGLIDTLRCFKMTEPCVTADQRTSRLWLPRGQLLFLELFDDAEANAEAAQGQLQREGGTRSDEQLNNSLGTSRVNYKL
jgi:hypothetical protein